MCTLFVYIMESDVKQVGIRQARQELPDLIDRAEAGEEIVITRQGRPVAKLVAAPKHPKPLPSLADFRGKLGRPGSPALNLVREERDAP
jgi:prevent-host-death family protein